jgi:hypothetical protein
MDHRQMAHDQRNSSLEIRLALDDERKLIVIEGLPSLRSRKDFELLKLLAAQYSVDLQARRAPARFKFTQTIQLTDGLKKSDEALRRQIVRFRTKVCELAELHWDVTLNREAIIQSRARYGYRLNPLVRLLDLAEILIKSHEWSPRLSQA